MRWSTLRGLSFALVLLAVNPDVARPGCTAVPDGRFTIQGPRGSVSGGFVYQGARVVIDIAPEDAAKLLLRDSGGAIAAADVTLTVVFKPVDSEETHTVFIAGNDDCSTLPAPTCCLERLFCPGPRECLTGKAVNLVTIGGSTGAQVQFDFPEAEFAGPVAIAVAPVAHATLRLETASCHDLLSNKDDEMFLAACIDELHEAAVVLGPGIVAKRAGDAPGPSLTVSSLVALASDNDFQAVCSTDTGEAPNCKGSADNVQYTVNRDGSVLLSIGWRKILRLQNGGPALQTRLVRGSSSVGAFTDGGAPIFVPSAQFLVSASKAALSFAPPPIFVPDPLAARPNEVTLSGTVDEGDSVLQILPRLLWGNACAGGDNAGQACEPATGAIDCPGSDATCQSVPTAYYTCVGGTRATLPCTRAQHCPGGTCGRGSNCYQRSTATFGVACTTDADCASSEQCGRGLFEFRNRVNPKGVGTLPRIGTAKLPGVCDSGEHDGQVCISSRGCTRFLFGPEKCVGYRAEAFQFLAH